VKIVAGQFLCALKNGREAALRWTRATLPNFQYVSEHPHMLILSTIVAEGEVKQADRCIWIATAKSVLNQQ
jgi:hypothetical protein